MMEFAEFILEHEGDDLGRLALARDRFLSLLPEFDLALTTLEVRAKLRRKVPEWYAQPALRYPLRVSGEQCSSSATARYKASVALAACGGASAQASFRLADLTGGLGVDSWAFAERFSEVLYNEMRPDLSDAARQNFAALGLSGVRVRNAECRPGHLQEILADFVPDMIYLDPARRASDGRKVFRLEDCQPAVPELLPELFAACPLLLLKLSPMADISLVCKQLGHVREVHVVAAEGECKELLLLLERDWSGPYALTVVEDGAVMALPADAASPTPACSAITLPGSLLFEPGKALLKAGAFDLPCRFGLAKLGRHTHLYAGTEVPASLRPFGKVFRILEAVPLSNRSIKEMGARYPRAEVSARNLPLSSDQLRAKLHVLSGGAVHIFGVKIDGEGNYLLSTCSEEDTPGTRG